MTVDYAGMWFLMDIQFVLEMCHDMVLPPRFIIEVLFLERHKYSK